MKSTDEQLKMRGFLSEQDYLGIKNQNTELLIKSTNSYERTAGVRNLRYQKTEENLEKLCTMLTKETSLYTKLEISDAITEYGCGAIDKIDNLIGKIGTNQHKEINNKDIGKKTYPLPRDLSARIMIRLGECVLDYYKGKLNGYDEYTLSEVIDVIGHITYHSRNKILEDELIQIYNSKESEILRWKIIKAFRSFDSEKVRNILEKETKNKNPIVVAEAKRSLEIIKLREIA